ncbi:hypothetical protein [Halopelagius longus]|uniref:Uncharacterized protein n=1 Tax=Halopelagius longus TaxID=1236180 RepID=A0A1H1GJ92_9EURY|nr:hypothetical protein [Halopelagius longus]RDI69706.1 hypothetical protein DWB78_18215 [Halopelagius longus]SDR13294.1 hypothetical protein SAMN05216278_3710 [Halopelagius longus]
MTRHYYDFFGDLLVEVVGRDGRTATQYRRMFDHFKVSSPDREPDMVIRETTDDVDPETVLGLPNDYYGWTGEKFVVCNGSDYMAARPGWNQVDVTTGFEPFYLIYPMELKIRQQRVEREQALIHASGVQIEGQTTLFPAWRGAGKTNTLLSLIRQGAGFLSDDRLWVGADGSAYGYPLGVNLGPYNFDSFPELERQQEHDGLEDRVRQEVYEFLDKQFDKSGSLPEMGIAYLNEMLLADDDRTFNDVASVYPGAEFVEESTVDNVMFLQAAPDTDTVAVERISTDEAMADATAISNFEWDGRLREYFHAYDSLVEGGNMVETLEQVIEGERAVFRELFEDVPIYRANIPRVRNWDERGLHAAMADTVQSLETREAVQTIH